MEPVRKNKGEILVVDNNPSNLKLLLSILVNEGYKVRPATSGKQALVAIDIKIPELFLLDINMPGMDGYELCRRIKENKKIHNIPVIFISANDSIEDRIKGFDIGGVDYITKPFQRQDVLVRVNTHLNLYNLQRDLEKKVQERTEELRSIRNYLSNIIDSMPSILIGVDIGGKVTQWNKSAEQNTGVAAKNAVGKILSDVFPNMLNEIDRIKKSIQTREVQTESRKTNYKSSIAVYEDVTIFPLVANGVEGAVIRIDDVSEKVRIEEMMIQSEKMLSVGGLAAGMAHEINNPLAGIIQSAEVISMRLWKDSDSPNNIAAAKEAGTSMESIRNFMEARNIPRMIDAINESGRRVAKIVDNMLSFARKSEDQKSSHNIQKLLDKTIELAATDYNMKKHYDFKKINIKKEYSDNLPMLLCEGSKIQQVLLNILRNGAQAMHMNSVENPNFIIRTAYKAEKHLIIIQIEDNGPGMNEDIRKRVFEPFFTTKSIDVGTGLGLSVSYFIITENHGGKIWVESSLGKGANFIISLPVKI